jgi:hypothetical protein
MVIPFYFDIKETKVWYPTFAIDYYRTFVSQYISFLERNKKWVNSRLSLKQIRQYGMEKSNELIIDDVESLEYDNEKGRYDSMWETAYSAPHRFADFFDRRFLVILDEFQNLTRFVYPDKDYKTAPS